MNGRRITDNEIIATWRFVLSREQTFRIRCNRWLVTHLPRSIVMPYLEWREKRHIARAKRLGYTDGDIKAVFDTFNRERAKRPYQ